MSVVEKLQQKLDGSHVKKNEDGMSYLETWYVIEKANEIFGFSGWSNETLVNEVVYDSEAMVTYKSISRVTALIDGQTSSHTGTGFFTQTKDMGVEKAHEVAGKNAEADSIKRAMYKFGYPLGLALYDPSQKNVDRGSNSPSQRVSENNVSAPKNNEKPPEAQNFEATSASILKSLGEDLRNWVKTEKHRKDMVSKYHSVESKWRNLSEEDFEKFNNGFRDVLDKHFPKEKAGMS